jgi:repressor LexA
MIGNALKRMRVASGMTQSAVAEKLDISTTSYNEYELDKKDPRPEGLIQICKILNTNPNYLYGFTESSEQALRPIPVLGLIRAGLPILAEDNYTEQITVGQFEHGADFALRVTGDSMIYAGIRSGDIVLMQQASSAMSGQIVAATVTDMDCMATLKYYVNGKSPVLRAANPRYQDQPITSNHRIIGVFCGLVRTEEPDMHEYQNMISQAEDVDDEWRAVMAELTSAGLGIEDVKNLVNVMKSIKK